MPVYETNKPTKDGRKYYFRCYYVDKYGKRKRYESKKYLGKRECERAERKFLESTEHKDLTDNDMMFVDVYNEWLDYKKTKVKSTTFYARKKRADYHILPTFKEYKLHSIKLNIITEWRDKILNLNISLEHRYRIVTDLKEILEYARDNYDFDNKIVAKVYKIRVDRVETVRNSEYNFWDNTSFKKFISVVDDEYYNLVFTFMYFTGLRLGEFIALTWHDVDLEKKKLRINKAFTNKIEGKVYDITTPKTKNSIRIIDLDDKLVERLKKYYKAESKIYGFNKNMYLFGNVDYLSPTTFKRYLYMYIEKYNNEHPTDNIRKITPHGFRHSHASLLIDLGLDFRDVADRLGDTPKVVENTYYHLFPQKKSNTVNALNKLNREP